MATRIVRLRSGEEILCNLTISEETYDLKNPAIIIPTPDGRLGMMPWLQYAELENNTVSIPKDFIIFDVAPHKELMNDYNSHIGTGLVTPKSSPELSLTT